MYTVKMTVLRRIVLLAAILLLTGTFVSARVTFSEKGFYCMVLPDSGAVMIMEYKCRSAGAATDSVFHIPSKILHDGKTFKVESIGENAFAGLAHLRSVVIDDGVEAIGDRAFNCCVNLRSVHIPASLVMVGCGVFAGCHSLTEIIVDPRNKYLDSRENSNAVIDSEEDKLLAACSATTIPGTVKSIGDYAFSYCSGINQIVIPDGVESIGVSAFLGCGSLRRISLPQSLREIGFEAFAGCRALESLFIPANVTTIHENNLFGWCDKLVSVVVDDANTMFDSRSGCNGIVRKADSLLIAACPGTTLVEGIAGLGYECFSRLKIHNVSLPKSLVRISSGAFMGCNEIDSICVDPANPYFTSPSGSNAILTKDGRTVVVGCRNTVIPEDVVRISENAFSGRVSDWVFRLPDGLQTIESYAFSGCDGIYQLIIPRSVTSIGDGAFSGCRNLAVVQMLCPLPVIRPYTFGNCPNLCVLGLPDGVGQIYKTAFANCGKLPPLALPSSASMVGD